MDRAHPWQNPGTDAPGNLLWSPPLVGRPVRLAIQMREAELFAIRLDCRAHYANGGPLDGLA
jgi:hypothetical protein